MTGNVVPLGNTVPGNARKAQMVEHFARKLDAVMADGAHDLSVVFIVYGHKHDAVSNMVSWDVAEQGAAPISMLLSYAAALSLDEVRKMRAPDPP